jgi:hypothetical protein
MSEMQYELIKIIRVLSRSTAGEELRLRRPLMLSVLDRVLEGE